MATQAKTKTTKATQAAKNATQATANKARPKTLADRAVVVSVSVSSTTGTKVNKKAGAEATASKGASSDAATVINRFLPKKAITNVTTARLGVINVLNSAPFVPWGDNERLLPTNQFYIGKEKLEKALANYWEKVEELKAELPALLESEKVKELLGEFAEDIELPTADSIAAKFHANVSFKPVPESGDFRQDVGAEIIKACAANLEEQTEKAEANIRQYIAGEISDVLSRLHKQVSKTGNCNARKDTVEAVTEIAQLARQMNVVEDSDIVSVCESIDKAFGKLTKDPKQYASELREDSKKREDALEKVSAIMEEMNGFFAPAA